nr:hypothetical protein [Deltaproteobacteria bacterium]
DQEGVTSSLGRAITARSDQLRTCVKGEGGKVVITLKVGADGSVRVLSVRGLEPAENACVANAVGGLTVSRKRGAPSFTVAVPIVILGSAPPPPPPEPAPPPAIDPVPPQTRLPDTTPNLLDRLHSIDDEVLACGDRFLGSTQAWVKIAIAPDGSVTSAVAKAEPAPLRECVEHAVKALRFSPSRAGKALSFGYKVAR